MRARACLWPEPGGTVRSGGNTPVGCDSHALVLTLIASPGGLRTKRREDEEEAKRTGWLGGLERRARRGRTDDNGKEVSLTPMHAEGEAAVCGGNEEKATSCVSCSPTRTHIGNTSAGRERQRYGGRRAPSCGSQSVAPDSAFCGGVSRSLQAIKPNIRYEK